MIQWEMTGWENLCAAIVFNAHLYEAVRPLYVGRFDMQVAETQVRNRYDLMRSKWRIHYNYTMPKDIYELAEQRKSYGD